jgi:hypothetical protein
MLCFGVEEGFCVFIYKIFKNVAAVVLEIGELKTTPSFGWLSSFEKLNNSMRGLVSLENYKGYFMYRLPIVMLPE